MSPLVVSKGINATEVGIEQPTQPIKPWQTNKPFEIVVLRSALSDLTHLLHPRNVCIIPVCEIHLEIIEGTPDMSLWSHRNVFNPTLFDQNRSERPVPSHGCIMRPGYSVPRWGPVRSSKRRNTWDFQIPVSVYGTCGAMVNAVNFSVEVVSFIFRWVLQKLYLLYYWNIL